MQHGGFSPDVSQYKMLGYLVRMLPETMTAFDAVWGALAVYAAWKITATVYGVCERGDLRYFRISNAIRISG